MDNFESNKEERDDRQNSSKMEDERSVVLEEALRLTGVGRYNYILFAFTVYSLQSAVSEIFGVSFLGTAAQCDLDLNVYKRGLIGSLPMLGMMLSGPIWGYIADTRGRKFTLCITMGGTFLMGIISSFANHWIFLAFMKFVSSMFASGTTAVIFTLLGESTPQEQRTTFLLYAASGVSQSVTAAVAFPILRATFSFPTGLGFNYRPWRLLAQTFGLMNGLNMLLLFLFVYESPKFYLSRGKQKEGVEILTKIFVANSGKGAKSYRVKHVLLEEEAASNHERNFIKSIWIQTAPLLYKAHIKNMMLMLYLCIVVYGAGPSLVMRFPEIMNSYSNNIDRVNEQIFCELVQERNESAINSTSELITGCDDRIQDLTFGFIFACGTYLLVLTNLMVFMVKVVGKKWTFIAVQLGSALATFLLNNISHISSLVLFVISISSAACRGITMTYAVELFPTYLRGMAVGLTMMVGRAFSFIVINAIAPLLESHCVMLFYGLGLFVLSGALAGCFLPSDREKIKKYVKN